MGQRKRDLNGKIKKNDRREEGGGRGLNSKIKKNERRGGAEEGFK